MHPPQHGAHVEPTARAIKVVEVGSLAVAEDPSLVLHTPAVGSGIAIALCAPERTAAALLYFLLPDSALDPKVAAVRPELFADTGTELLLHRVHRCGIETDELRAYLVGGADLMHVTSSIALGERNAIVARAALQAAGIPVVAARTGGLRARRIAIELSSGKVRITETPTPRRSHDSGG